MGGVRTMWKPALLMVPLMIAAAWAAGEVTMNVEPYNGWANCVRLTNGNVDLVVTTDVGPRVIRFGFVGEQNVFKEYPDQAGKTGGGEWRIYGGHRLWHAPEAKPRTYSPDNAPVKHEWNGTTLRLTQPTEADTGIQKQMEITLDADMNRVRVLHRLINRNAWDVTLAPWALTVMAPGGRAIYPQEPYISHTEKLLPARPVVLWNYTNMNDPRWTWGEKYIQLQQDSKADTPQKIGIRNSLGWSAYTLNGDVFVKQFPHNADAVYPDYGCNNETFTNGDMLEVESVGPLAPLAADGGAVEHIEQWGLFKAEVGASDADIDKNLLPLIQGME